MTEQESYFIDRSKSIRKSVIIFKEVGNVASPIMYIKKPKWLSEKDFNDYMDAMQISINLNKL